jgi:hypothetical protein
MATAGHFQVPLTSTPPARFEFVTDHDPQTQIRQHVAKLAWRKRREQKAVPPRTGIHKIASKPNQPRPVLATSARQQVPEGRPGQYQIQTTVPMSIDNDVEEVEKPQSSSNGVYMDLRHTLILVSPRKEWKLSTVPTPFDHLISPYAGLDMVELDPFNSITELSRADQRLLHHCR